VYTVFNKALIATVRMKEMAMNSNMQKRWKPIFQRKMPACFHFPTRPSGIWLGFGTSIKVSKNPDHRAGKYWNNMLSFSVCREKVDCEAIKKADVSTFNQAFTPLSQRRDGSSLSAYLSNCVKHGLKLSEDVISAEVFRKAHVIPQLTHSLFSYLLFAGNKYLKDPKGFMT
jgi:hypothetical protein